MDIVEGSIAAAAAVFSGWAAYSAMRAARSSDRNAQTANRTAELAFQTAEAVAQIERDRWHSALTPQLEMRQRPDGLELRLAGPAAIGQLQVDLQIRDDRDRSNDPDVGTTREQRAEVIWGPKRFRPGIDLASSDGRTVGPLFLEPGDMTRVATDPTLRPDWYEGVDGEQRWRQQYRDERMRLWAVCTAEGHKPWRLSFEVPRGGHWAITGPIAQV
ncbi:hypothetical protein ACFYU4_38020 [Streptomyces tendae]|uniref:hypothetical protein n=1 Tax=Streptomyces tendae TaxID=1932 RepID=UPI00369DB00F